MITMTNPEALQAIKMTGLLLSYHNNPALKQARINLVRQHREMDLLAQNMTGNPMRGEKGCAVACTVAGYDHQRYAPELGIPPAWAYLEDAVFEGLPVADAQVWPEQFLQAVPVGVDLWPAFHRVVARIILEVSLPQVRACREPEPSATRIETAIRDVAALYEQSAQGGPISPTQAYWTAYQSAAESAAMSAAAAYQQVATIILEELQR